MLQIIDIKNVEKQRKSIIYNIAFIESYMEVTYMESQEYTCYYETNKKCRKFNCLAIVAVILSILFFFVLGLLIGAAISGAILGALAAVIVLAVVLFILLILTIILLICKRPRKYCKC